MTRHRSRVAPSLVAPTLEGRGEDVGGVGRRPDRLEADAVVRLISGVQGDARERGGRPESIERERSGASLSALAATLPVAGELTDRAQLQPLDLAILRHLRHLQRVCQRPRLQLAVEEVRVPVARAKRCPVGAVADLVSHPENWEHRTLRSIQPARVLARQSEDDWDLYENRVAVRLVELLLVYLGRRVAELRRIEETLSVGRDYGEQARASFWRARRLTTLWGETVTAEREDETRETMRRLVQAQRDLRALQDMPLFRKISRRVSVSRTLRPTNILVNDPHYRRVAQLWRAWRRFGYEADESRQQRAERHRREERAWETFALLLVVRAFDELGWRADGDTLPCRFVRAGWTTVRVGAGKGGAVEISCGEDRLRFLPVFADLSDAEPEAIRAQLRQWDEAGGEVVGVHVGGPAVLGDDPRAYGWSTHGSSCLLACSPWSLDSSERVARVLAGWLARYAMGAYPPTKSLRGLPGPPALDDAARAFGPLETCPV